jgi:SAM-dependent methyltransferase
MALIDFMSHIHKSTNRDYIGRVNDMDYPKARAAKLCKDWGFEYWDGDRRICYGGYQYIPGRWAPVGKAIIEHYGLKPGDKILDIGCGKGYQLYELTQLMPGIEVYGIDISEYAIQNGKEEIKHRLKVCSATNLPFPDNYFDFVFSLNVLHNLPNYDLVKALQEMERVGAKDKYLCVESFRNEVEKVNLLYWQVTCSAFCSPEEWGWWFKTAGYTGDHSFIFFE